MHDPTLTRNSDLTQAADPKDPLASVTAYPSPHTLASLFQHFSGPVPHPGSEVKTPAPARGNVHLTFSSLSAFPVLAQDDQSLLAVDKPGMRKRYGPVRRLKKYQYANVMLAAAAREPATVTAACLAAGLSQPEAWPILHLMVRDGKIRRPERYQPLDVIDPSPYDLGLLRRGLSWKRVGNLSAGDYAAFRLPERRQRPVVLDLAAELPEERLQAYGDRLYYGQGSPMYVEIVQDMQAYPGRVHAWGQLRALCRERGWSREAYESAQNTLSKGLTGAYWCPRFLPINPQTAALFGYWVAEGSVYRTGITFASHQAESGYRAEIAAALEAFTERPGVTYFVPGTNGCSHTLSCKPLACLLVRLFGDKANTKRLPIWWIDLPDDVLRSFLRALFNGDGCCFQTGPRRRISLKTTSPVLAWQVRLILLKLGVNAAINEHKPRVARMRNGRTIRSGIAYSVNVNGPAASVLAGLLGYAFTGEASASGTAVDSGASWYMDDAFLYLRVNAVTQDPQGPI